MRPIRWGVVVCLLAATASAEAFSRFEGAARGSGFPESFTRVLRETGNTEDRADDLQPCASLQAEGTAATAEATETPGGLGVAVVGPAQQKAPKTAWIGVVTAATVLGSAYNSFSDGRNQRFHFTNEGFFGRNTYAGGGDKASHFVSYAMIAKLLAGVYAELGMPTDRARLLGAGVAVFAGFVTELGDGRGRYGFSYEDLFLDLMGASAQLAIAHYGLEDLVGFSAGLVPRPSVVCCPYGGTGKDYTREIYSGDLKLAGLALRAHVDPGPARFLLFSLAYSSKGYPYASPDVRERQIGAFVGLNFVEVLHAVGVNDTTSWGRLLCFLFDVIRIPYTQIGYQYDINHRRWHGPTIGDAFPGGGH